MFDPHGTRRSDRRYYTRKGQILQASRVNIQPIIEQRLVPVYKQYIVNNNLLETKDPNVYINRIMYDSRELSDAEDIYVNIADMTLSTESTVQITMTHNTSGYASGYFIIYKDLEERIYFKVFAIQSGSQTVTITGNAKCYYQSVPLSATDYNYFTSGPFTCYNNENFIVVFEGDEFQVSPTTPIKLL